MYTYIALSLPEFPKLQRSSADSGGIQRALGMQAVHPLPPPRRRVLRCVRESVSVCVCVCVCVCVRVCEREIARERSDDALRTQGPSEVIPFN